MHVTVCFIEIQCLILSVILCLKPDDTKNHVHESQIYFRNKTLKPMDHAEKLSGWVFSQAVSPRATLSNREFKKYNMYKKVYDQNTSDKTTTYN